MARPVRFAIPLLLLLCAPAYAQQGGGGAEAEQLFRDAKQLMQKGRFGEACNAFQASQKLDPAVTTVMNLADCREKNGQIATAWSLFLEVERLTRGDAKQDALHRTAQDRAKKLEPRLSYLTVSVPDESRVSGLVLTRNGTPLEEVLWNRAIPVDGGEYTIGGQAPGHEVWQTIVTIAPEKGKHTVDVPKFKQVDALMVPAPNQTKPQPEGEVQEDELIEPPSALTPRRKIALGVAGGAVIAGGAGLLLGLQAKGYEQDAADLCPTTNCADAAAANALVDKAEQRALFANVAYGVGAAALVGAAVLWFTGAPDEAPAEHALVPRVGPDSVALDVLVRF